MPLWVIFLTIAGYLLGQIISAFKWWVIARAGGLDSSLPNALKAYFIGMFVNCFGFGIVGGDLARGMLLTEGKGHKTPAVISVVADRAHGLAVLALLGAVATIFFKPASIDPQLLYLLFAIGLSIVVGWFIGPKILLRLVPPTKALHAKMLQISNVFPKDNRTIFWITLISILFHLLQITLHWIIGFGFGLNLSWTLLLVSIPFVNILSSLPISWNGLGVRENAYIFFLVPAALSNEQAIATGAIWLLAVTFSSAVGGIIAFSTKNFGLLKKLKEEQQQQ